MKTAPIPKASCSTDIRLFSPPRSEAKTCVSRRGSKKEFTGSFWLGLMRLSFFFQAEDGIRDLTVTGVQTCALPISGGLRGIHPGSQTAWAVLAAHEPRAAGAPQVLTVGASEVAARHSPGPDPLHHVQRSRAGGHEIGRASCRERG